MIQEMMEKFNQLYVGFVNLPIEGQVVSGVGALVVLAALKNLWSLLYPARWGIATSLRGLAYAIHPRGRQPKTNNPKATKAPKFHAPVWDLSTNESLRDVVLYYGSKNNVATLSKEQMTAIINVSASSKFKKNGVDKKFDKAYFRIRDQRDLLESEQKLAEAAQKYGA